MIYLNEKDIEKIGVDWRNIVNQVRKAVECIGAGDYSQPVKPYLRYGEPQNRIIAMPAFVGGDFNMAGIKWIASFPDNIHKNIPRAHSVIVLNDSATGAPVAVINTALISILRTAGLSGLVIDTYLKSRDVKDLKLGIIGFGPIGRNHLKMCMDLFGDRISKVSLFDLNKIDKNKFNLHDKRIEVMNTWEECYENSDVFITCTVSKEPYIDKKPKAGALLLNVSLRDYKPDIYDFVKNSIIVDDWDDVCRENTDIERMSKEKGLSHENTKSIVDLVCKDCINAFGSEQTIMFNPMGMAVFDIAVAQYYYSISCKKNVGQVLD